MAKLSIREAIKLLQRYDNEHYTPQHREVHRMAVKALEQTQWIPVTERLPEKSGRYLVITEIGYSDVLDYSAVHKAFNAFDDIANRSEIYCSHWMPLIATPKKEENDETD